MDKSVLIKLCEENHITIAELEKTLGMSNGSLRKEGDIKSQRLKAIADYFHVSMEYLMGVDYVAPVQPDGFLINDEDMEILSKIKASDENKKRMIMYLLAYKGDNNETT